jgi:expansin (peptidoglycan-binding protein)
MLRKLAQLWPVILCSAALITPARTQSISGFIVSGEKTGQATFYDSDGQGHCSFDAREDNLFGAMTSALWSKAAFCGVCVQISHDGKSITVPIVDECPGCDPAGIDLSRTAFRALAPESKGRIDISWTVVPCPVSGPLRYRYKPDINPQYLALQVLNAPIPIRSVECRVAGSNDAWQTLERTVDNYFTGSAPGGRIGPLDFRITPYGGNAVEDLNVDMRAGSTITGKATLGTIQLPQVTVSKDPDQTRVSLNSTLGNIDVNVGKNKINVSIEEEEGKEKKVDEPPKEEEQEEEDNDDDDDDDDDDDQEARAAEHASDATIIPYNLLPLMTILSLYITYQNI